MSATRESSPRGAYGFALTGVEPVREYLVPAPDGWPELELVRNVGDASAELDTLTSYRAELILSSGGTVLIEREPRRAVFTTPMPLRDEELVHPFLAPVAAVSARWLDRESLHAGAFALDSGAWALVGEREAGKSSILAHLALAGVDIVSDDVLVIAGTTAFAGPRSIDLRAEPARHLEAGDAVGKVGARERWRLRLGPVAAELPLRGWVSLGWGERVEARRLPGAARIPELARHRALNVPSTKPEALLDLAALPAWELRRPPGWSSMDDAARCLLETVAC